MRDASRFLWLIDAFDAPGCVVQALILPTPCIAMASTSKPTVLQNAADLNDLEYNGLTALAFSRDGKYANIAVIMPIGCTEYAPVCATPAAT